jgi:hypothetical protein
MIVPAGALRAGPKAVQDPAKVKAKIRGSLDVPGRVGESVVIRRSCKEGWGNMPGMAIPLAADKLDAWEAWVAELNGPRKAAFDDMNVRHGLTEHRAYLQPTPDGGFLVLVITDGPGAESFLANAASSDEEFDRWFMGSVAEVHGMDTSGPMPPMATRKL